MTAPPERTALYRLYAIDDQLLYVGISNDPKERMKAHATDKSWWGKVALREIEWFGSRLEAEVAELTAIYREQPLYNVTGNVRRRIGRRSRATYLHPLARHHFKDQPFTLKDLAEQLHVSHGTVSNYAPELTKKGAFRKVGTEPGTRRTLYVAVRASGPAGASRGMGLLPHVSVSELREAASTAEALPAAFAEALRSRRVACGMSFADLARQVGFHRGFIHRVETGERAPNRRLAEAADVALNAGGALVEAFAADEAVDPAEAGLRVAIAKLKGA